MVGLPESFSTPPTPMSSAGIQVANKLIIIISSYPRKVSVGRSYPWPRDTGSFPVFHQGIAEQSRNALFVLKCRPAAFQYEIFPSSQGRDAPKQLGRHLWSDTPFQRTIVVHSGYDPATEFQPMFQAVLPTLLGGFVRSPDNFQRTSNRPDSWIRARLKRYP